ncbi:Esterase-like activity of phytase [Streptomyces sp. LamerLS-316]|uniref:esterase-like activity of phytase family protein n=1 Tax=unclassified Streptomyces TaxID=2593676 RepID=UPI000823DABE|nr:MULTISPECIES: esterase-like activity of phytase family protein [unclassified Streptomyces]MYQ37927.1 alkaline phosphatase [Streptomyces sp. SID4921]SCK47871.1 Esterase-like activity of phytase [Streptomyces sp. LamerLS-316]
MLPKRTCAALAVLAVTAGTLAGAGAASAGQPHGGDRGRNAVAFERTATYPVFQNRPAGEDASAQTVAEISATSEDGRTLVYTDAAARRIGFLDISDAGRPRGLGTLSLAALGDAEDEPTSVSVVGQYVLVVVNTSASYTRPSGRLDVISLRTRQRVASHDLGGQPDSIAISKDKRYAAVAIENERDEEATPAGGEEGDLPQAPAGFVQIVDIKGSSPARWTTRAVPLTAPDGSALPALVAAGITAPTDPEPEYVSVNGRGQLAVTLQENNGVVVIDLASGRLTKAFTAGTADIEGIDTADDGVIDQTGSLTGVPREPDALGWIDDRYLATADEGDWKGGTRGWTVFDSRTGKAVRDAGNSFERLAARHGLLDDSRSEKKGTEPEGLAIGTYDGVRYAFVGSERSNFVAVYDISKPTRPVFRQVLPTTNGPEGLLPIPSRGLLAVSSEEDDADAGVRASVSLFRLGRGTPSYPSLVSASDSSGTGAPIGWGALGALSAVPGRTDELYTVTDAAYATTRILTVRTDRKPAVITRELTVKDAAGKPVGYDAEGIHARPQGGFWLAVEGRSGAGNQLVRLDRDGVTQQVVPLPSGIAAGLGSQGFEGVTATTGRDGREIVWAALQREAGTDPAGVVRLGRYDVRAGTWSWYGYRLGTTTTPGDWLGLSEITVVGDRLAVIERDKLNGPAARVKRIYTVDLPTSAAPEGALTVLPKTLAHDVLPDLRATKGWTQEKLEGLTVGGDGHVYAVTDNDGLDDSTGETVFLDLGTTRKVLGRG